MTQKAINFKFVLPTVSAIAFAIIISIGVIYLKDKYPLPVGQAGSHQPAANGQRSAELPNAERRLWRMHVLLR